MANRSSWLSNPLTSESTLDKLVNARLVTTKHDPDGTVYVEADYFDCSPNPTSTAA